MTKIKGPLFSVTARGSVGPRLTFSRRASGQQVRYQRAQKDYVNDARQQQRFYFSLAMTWWQQMTADDQALFNGYTAKDK